jgi:uncharacterized Zn finger protein (UPF0148 family)
MATGSEIEWSGGLRTISMIGSSARAQWSQSVGGGGKPVAKTCAQCGQPLSLFQRLGSGHCSECQAEIDRQQAEATQAEMESRQHREREVAAKRYAAALQGEASPDDLRRLESEGYLIAGGRLILCPVCGHDRFHQQRTLMNTRAATFFNLDWANSGADTRICQRCTHVMWFARA